MLEAGWTVGDAGDFLGLSVDERRFVDVKLALADGLRRRREELGLTQGQVAERLGSSQSRVAKMSGWTGTDLGRPVQRLSGALYVWGQGLWLFHNQLFSGQLQHG